MLNNKNKLLYPVSLIYSLVTGLRNFLYDHGIFRSVKFKTPIICIGNITVGGTGKTPHTEYIINLLKQHFNIAVLSRGYKRKTRDFIIASASSTVEEIGDEPLQIARKFPGIMVAVERDRVKGVNKILEIKPETDVIVLDDGYQHRHLRPGFSILLSDYGRPMKSDNLLPYGSLRENKKNSERADNIIITKTPVDISSERMRALADDLDKLPDQRVYFTGIKYHSPVSVFKKNEEILQLFWNSFQENGALIVTGIANPDPLLQYIKKFFSEIVHLRFPDHHNFTADDILTISTACKELKSANRYVITTEKDAVRIRELTFVPEYLRSIFYYVPVGIEFLNGKDEFEKTIIEYVRTNKRDVIIS
jgi:tetraacyldisaccharide 4'-kinase